MEIGMFIVGSLIFIAYMFGLLTMINKSHKEQEKEFPTKADEVDMDGMGNYGRFPATKKMDVRKRSRNKVTTVK
jgi:hypothetical protein